MIFISKHFYAFEWPHFMLSRLSFAHQQIFTIKYHLFFFRKYLRLYLYHYNCKSHIVTQYGIVKCSNAHVSGYVSSSTVQWLRFICAAGRSALILFSNSLNIRYCSTLNIWVNHRKIHRIKIPSETSAYLLNLFI